MYNANICTPKCHDAAYRSVQCVIVTKTNEVYKACYMYEMYGWEVSETKNIYEDDVELWYPLPQ